MKAPLKLGLFAAGMVAVFVVTYLTAGALIPADTAAAWSAQAAESADDHDADHAGNSSGGPEAPSVAGLAVEQSGYRIQDVTAPAAAGEDGMLSFALVGPDGDAVTDYTVAHDKELHMIVVRSDGAQFRHVHPERTGAGRWSIPWHWDTGGSYRVFADFVPADLGSNVTVTSTVTVTGAVAPAPSVDSTVARTGDFTVSLAGGLTAGGSSALTFQITRAGSPVTTLQPYLGAFGHLVALRAGDLAYLHVHPVDQPANGTENSGPQITFMAEAPTEGEYLLYLDFQVDAQVYTAAFEVTASAGSSGSTHGDIQDSDTQDSDTHDSDTHDSDTEQSDTGHSDSGH